LRRARLLTASTVTIDCSAPAAPNFIAISGFVFRIASEMGSTRAARFAAGMLYSSAVAIVGGL
jgi:hypothetical protein